MINPSDEIQRGGESQRQRAEGAPVLGKVSVSLDTLPSDINGFNMQALEIKEQDDGSYTIQIPSERTTATIPLSSEDVVRAPNGQLQLTFSAAAAIKEQLSKISDQALQIVDKLFSAGVVNNVHIDKGTISGADINALFVRRQTTLESKIAADIKILEKELNAAPSGIFTKVFGVQSKEKMEQQKQLEQLRAYQQFVKSDHELLKQVCSGKIDLDIAWRATQEMERAYNALKASADGDLTTLSSSSNKSLANAELLSGGINDTETTPWIYQLLTYHNPSCHTQDRFEGLQFGSVDDFKALRFGIDVLYGIQYFPSTAPITIRR
jgi:hypothetical protein